MQIVVDPDFGFESVQFSMQILIRWALIETKQTYLCVKGLLSHCEKMGPP